jgi:hypothetical protein
MTCKITLDEPRDAAKLVSQALDIPCEAQSAKVRNYFRKPLISLKSGCEAQTPPYPLRARARVSDARVRVSTNRPECRA